MTSYDCETLPWYQKISHHAQVGGIETSVLDNGAGRGTRIAWINTGTGLRYKVVIDRAMDIADAFYNQHSLAWLSHSGVTPPQPFSSTHIDWLKTFGGGFITTCGLDHVGPPDEFAGDKRGLHGPISNIPAEIISIQQPDPAKGKLRMSITGRVLQTQVFGPTLELIRTISGTIGEPIIEVEDTVTNLANTRAPHMLLYHINIGWPLADEGARLFFDGDSTPRYDGVPNKIFRDGVDYYQCLPPLTDHDAYGEEALLIRPAADTNGVCTCGIINEKIGVRATVSFKKEQLPCLTNWQHWGRGEYVTGLEPANCFPEGRVQADREGRLQYLAPGESRSYRLAIDVKEI